MDQAQSDILADVSSPWKAKMFSALSGVSYGISKYSPQSALVTKIFNAKPEVSQTGICIHFPVIQMYLGCSAE